jgi:hypothetical protein
MFSWKGEAAVAKDAGKVAPQPTAARVALWRARHIELDGTLFLLIDGIGLRTDGLRPARAEELLVATS